MASKITKEAAIDDKQEKIFELGEEKAGVDEKTRTVEVVVSSEKRDRDGDRILQKGIDHSHAKSVLWGHNYGRDGQLPIAKIVEARSGTRKGDKVTIEKHQFPPEGKYQLADDVFELIKEGIIGSTSIGFIPKKVRNPETDEERKELDLGPHGVLFEEIEKLETSWVPVPSNREAVVLAHEKGLIKSAVKDLVPAPEKEPKDEALDLIETARGKIEAVLDTVQKLNADIEEKIEAFDKRIKAVEESARNRKPEIDDGALGDMLKGMTRTPADNDKDSIREAVCGVVRETMATGLQTRLRKRLGLVDTSKLTFRKRS